MRYSTSLNNYTKLSERNWNWWKYWNYNLCRQQTVNETLEIFEDFHMAYRNNLKVLILVDNTVLVLDAAYPKNQVKSTAAIPDLCRR